MAINISVFQFAHLGYSNLLSTCGMTFSMAIFYSHFKQNAAVVLKALTYPVF